MLSQSDLDFLERELIIASQNGDILTIISINKILENNLRLLQKLMKG